MKKDSLSYETIQSMLLEKMQERSYSAVSVTLCANCAADRTVLQSKTDAERSERTP